jgi:hypothetical protein
VALSETQIQECLRATGAFIAKRRPPPHVRDQLDYRADIRGSTITIVSVRPRFDDPSSKIDHPIARVRWIGTKKEWRMYWMRADLKWHAYEPASAIRSISDALEEVHRDPYGCFFG